jgi:uncharacterized membrane protein YfcA
MSMGPQVLVWLVLIGLVAGMLSGLVGIGGGLVMVPAMVWLLGYSQHQAQGTSLAVLMLPVVFLAARDYYKAGHIDPKVVGVIAAAFVVGGYFGGKWALALPADQLRKVFGVILLLASIKLLLNK